MVALAGRSNPNEFFGVVTTTIFVPVVVVGHILFVDAFQIFLSYFLIQLSFSVPVDGSQQFSLVVYIQGVTGLFLSGQMVEYEI